ncbi:MAG: GvpL/GvpF family gas vesicle protein [Methylocystis silviterrae]
MAEVESFPLAGSDADLPLAAAEEAICLFAFIECADSLEPPDEPPERRLMLHRVGTVVALIGVAPMADYCGADAERRLADVAWLAPRVRRHAEIMDWAMRRSPVFPVPFGTLYSNIASLTTFMRAHEATIADFFEAVADKEEWELRAVAQFDRPDILDKLACNKWPDWRELPKGARYMRLCRDRAALVDFGCAEAAAFVSDFVLELRPLTAGIRLQDIHRLPDSEGSRPIARYALLVPLSNVAAMRTRIEEIAADAARRDVTVTLSGPWPPFSFRPDLKSPQ